MQQFITDRLPQIEELCRTHHVQRMTIFGSAVRDDFNPETSDVDVRVAFLAKASEDYLKILYALEDTLPVLFGRKVDLLSGRIRNTYLLREIESHEVVVYEVA